MGQVLLTNLVSLRSDRHEEPAHRRHWVCYSIMAAML
jgi:hypothetical protein